MMQSAPNQGASPEDDEAPGKQRRLPRTKRNDKNQKMGKGNRERHRQKSAKRYGVIRTKQFLGSKPHRGRRSGTLPMRDAPQPAYAKQASLETTGRESSRAHLDRSLVKFTSKFAFGIHGPPMDKKY